jgi:hypothetical protein
VNVLDLESIPWIDSEGLRSGLENSKASDPHFVIAASDRAKDGLAGAVTECICDHILAAIQQLNPQRSTDWTIVFETDLDSQLNV